MSLISFKCSAKANVAGLVALAYLLKTQQYLQYKKQYKPARRQTQGESLLLPYMARRITNLLSMLFLLWPFAVSGEVKYQVNVSESVASTIEREQFERLLDQIYAPLNIQPEYVYYPSQRGLPLVNAGDVDADAARYVVAVSEYENLIQVPEPLGTIGTVVLCREEQNCQLSSNVTVGVLKGFLIANEFCRIEDKLCYFSENPSVLAKLLDSNRVDAVLVQRHLLPSIVCNSESSEFFTWHYAAFDLPNYHYVHSKNKHLVDALAESIKVQKNTPLYQAITQQWLARARDCGKTISTISTN